MTPLVPSRTCLFVLLLAAWGFIVVGRLAQIQIAQADRYRARAQRQQEHRIEISGRRGSILDREGRELAVSVEVSSVYADPEQVGDPDAAARALAPLLGQSERFLAAKLAQRKGFLWLARKVEPAVARQIGALRLAGIHLIEESKRFYPKGSLAGAVLGYVGTDDRGLGGLEYLYNSALKGKPGEIVALTDARRSTYGEAESDPSHRRLEGDSLVLSIDSGIQYAAEGELAATVAELHARSGTVVLLEPENGEVLAMASAPGFDPNQFGRFAAEDRRNRAIADAYEPGSTFKIVTGAIALEEHLVRLDEIIDTGRGVIQIGNVTINEDRHHDYGALTLAGVFERSSNIGIIRVGLRLGPERLYSGVSAFGIGRPTGVDLPGEHAGIFRPLSRWSSLSNASISMGQEVALTALQLARVVAAIANGGRLIQPRLVTRIVHPDGRVEVPSAPLPTRVLSAETARSLREILVGVVERGTGTTAAIPGFRVAGKTGTAQKAGPGGYQSGRYVPNFVGFAPAEEPRIVGVVVIEEPRGKYYSREVAAPLFARIVSRALGILRVSPREQQIPETVLASSPTRTYPAGVVPASLREGGAFTVKPSRQTPDVSGRTAREALALFRALALPVRIEGSGWVVSQAPPPGTRLDLVPIQVLYLSGSPPVSRPPVQAEETIPPPVP